MRHQKVILITGASPSDGGSTAALLSKAYTVFGTSRNPGAEEAMRPVEMQLWMCNLMTP